MADSNALTTDWEKMDRPQASENCRRTPEQGNLLVNEGSSRKQALVDRASARAVTCSSARRRTAATTSAAGLLDASRHGAGLAPVTRCVSLVRERCGDSAPQAQQHIERASSNVLTCFGSYALGRVVDQQSERRSNAAASCKLLRCSMRSRQPLNSALTGTADAASVGMGNFGESVGKLTGRGTKKREIGRKLVTKFVTSQSAQWAMALVHPRLSSFPLGVAPTPRFRPTSCRALG